MDTLHLFFHHCLGQWSFYGVWSWNTHGTQYALLLYEARHGITKSQSMRRLETIMKTT